MNSNRKLRELNEEFQQSNSDDDDDDGDSYKYQLFDKHVIPNVPFI